MNTLKQHNVNNATLFDVFLALKVCLKYFIYSCYLKPLQQYRFFYIEIIKIHTGSQRKAKPIQYKIF